MFVVADILPAYLVAHRVIIRTTVVVCKSTTVLRLHAACARVIAIPNKLYDFKARLILHNKTHAANIICT